jgi:hypothetical protein
LKNLPATLVQPPGPTASDSGIIPGGGCVRVFQPDAGVFQQAALLSAVLFHTCRQPHRVRRGQRRKHTRRALARVWGRTVDEGEEIELGCAGRRAAAEPVLRWHRRRGAPGGRDDESCGPLRDAHASTAPVPVGSHRVYAPRQRGLSRSPAASFVTALARMAKRQQCGALDRFPLARPPAGAVGRRSAGGAARTARGECRPLGEPAPPPAAGPPVGPVGVRGTTGEHTCERRPRGRKVPRSLRPVRRRWPGPRASAMREWCSLSSSVGRGASPRGHDDFQLIMYSTPYSRRCPGAGPARRTSCLSTNAEECQARLCFRCPLGRAGTAPRALVRWAGWPAPRGAQAAHARPGMGSPRWHGVTDRAAVAGVPSAQLGRPAGGPRPLGAVRPEACPDPLGVPIKGSSSRARTRLQRKGERWITPRQDILGLPRCWCSTPLRPAGDRARIQWMLAPCNAPAAHRRLPQESGCEPTSGTRSKPVDAWHSVRWLGWWLRPPWPGAGRAYKAAKVAG